MFRTFYRPNSFCMLTYYAKGSACKKNQCNRRCATSVRTHVSLCTRMRARVRTRVRACARRWAQTCARADVSHLLSPQLVLHAGLLCKGSSCRKNQDDMKCATSLRTHVTRMRSRVRTRVRACMCTTSQRVTCVRADFAHLLLP